MKKTYLQKGFTLIELLVVIAIIGILSSVVLASLSTARNKGNDAKVKAQLSAVRSAVELYANSGSYVATNNVDVAACTGVMFTDVPSGLASLTGNDKAWPIGTKLTCQSSDKEWLVAASLSEAGKTWCVDSAGNSKGLTVAITAGTYKCP